MIWFNKVGKSFGADHLFQNLDFSIEAGQRAVITGTSGSGKKTILNMIAGLEKPDTGTIAVFKPEKFDAWKVRQQIAFVFQHPVFAKGSVLDNIISPFLFKVNKQLRPDRNTIIEHLKKTGLERDILEKSPDQLSGGQKQRVALIIGKLLHRKLFLLDEPTSALDPDSKKLVIDYILNDPEITIVSVSHDPEWTNLFPLKIDLDKKAAKDG